MKEILLANKQACLVDDECFDEYYKDQWYMAPSGPFKRATYQTENGQFRVTSVYMHRLIMKAMPNQTVLRKLHNVLDNQKDNLYFQAPRRKPGYSRPHSPDRQSLFRGVKWDKIRSKWLAITDDEKLIGRFSREENAAKERDEFLISRLGQISDLNFPLSDYPYLLDPSPEKVCAKCGQSKPLSEFPRHPNTHDLHIGSCKMCRKEYARQHDSKPDRKLGVRRKSEELKWVPCADCHVQYPPYVMQFHHVDPSTKSNSIPQISSVRALMRESEKCVILCANCHLEREWGENGLSKIRIVNMKSKLKLAISI